MRTVTVISAIILYSIAASAQNGGDKITYGKIINSVYSNPYFGFEIKIPRTWYIMDSKAVREVTENNSAAGNKSETKTMVDASGETMLNFLTAFRFARTAPGVCNPNILCMAEKIGGDDGVKYAIDYLRNVKSLMTSAHQKMNYTFSETASSEKIDGITFDILTAQLKSKDAVITQRFYTSIIKGYAFTFIISSSTKEEEALLKEILSSTRFDKAIFMKQRKDDQKSTAVPAASDAPKK